MNVVVCYAVHDEEIACYEPFVSWQDASKFLKEDSQNVYDKERLNGWVEEDVTIWRDTNNRPDKAKVTSCAGEYVWTWEIIEF